MKELALTLVNQCQSHVRAGQIFANQQAVHELRKATKRLRAYWHLVAGTMGKRAARDRRADLRDASGQLAESRDHTVLQEFSRELAGELDGKFSIPFGQLHSWVTLHPPNTKNGVEEFLAETFLREQCAWEQLPEPDELVLDGAIAKSQSLEARRRRTAQGSADAEAWHNWRKSVKRLSYQLSALHGEEDTRVLAWGDLGSKLGRLNDLYQIERALAVAEIHDEAPERIHSLVRALQSSCNPPTAES